MTEEENHLWFDFLSALPVRVKRQKVIGRYIVDFYIPKAKPSSKWTAYNTPHPKHSLPITSVIYT